MSCGECSIPIPAAVRAASCPRLRAGRLRPSSQPGCALLALLSRWRWPAAARGARRSRRRMCPTPIRAPIRVSDFFSYRGDELHAEEIAGFADRDCRRHPLLPLFGSGLHRPIPALCRGFFRGAAADLLCGQGQFEPRRPAPLRRSRGRRRRRLGRRVAPRSRRRRAAAADRLLRGRQDSGRTRGGARRRDPPDQRRIGAGAAPAERARQRTWPDRAGRDPGQSGCRRAHPRQDFDRHEREQIRHRSRRGGSRLRLAAKLPGIDPVGLAVHIGSQLVDLEPYRRAFTRVAGLVRELRGEGACRCPRRSRRRARRSATETRIPPSQAAMPDWHARFSVRPGSPSPSSRDALSPARPGCSSLGSFMSKRALPNAS